MDVRDWNAALNLAALCVAAIAAAWSIGTEDHNSQVLVNLVGETTAWFLGFSEHCSLLSCLPFLPESIDSDRDSHIVRTCDKVAFRC